MYPAGDCNSGKLFPVITPEPEPLSEVLTAKEIKRKSLDDGVDQQSIKESPEVVDTRSCGNVSEDGSTLNVIRYYRLENN